MRDERKVQKSIQMALFKDHTKKEKEKAKEKPKEQKKVPRASDIKFFPQLSILYESQINNEQKVYCVIL